VALLRNNHRFSGCLCSEIATYSKGNYTEESDIDIAVVVSKRSENYFEDTPLLWKLGRKVSCLIEPVLLTEDDDCPLYEDILRTGVLV
jgi:predicted nucleotidyltransferase